MLFVGEKKSPTALRRGWSWEDGRLAAKQLFDALTACGVDPSTCNFANWFNTRDRSRIRGYTGPVFAMGKSVQVAMTKAGVEFTPLVHPAARGKIRQKQRYIAHVRDALRRSGHGSELEKAARTTG